MNVIGLDLSLTGTGIVSQDGACTVKLKKFENDTERLLELKRLIMQYLENADFVLVEGLAFASHTGKATERAGLWWMIATTLYAADIPLAVCPPATLKKYATGKGNADKDTVMLASSKMYPELEVHNNNEADAKVLYLMGKHYLDTCLFDVPKLQRDALDKVAWPVIKDLNNG